MFSNARRIATLAICLGAAAPTAHAARPSSSPGVRAKAGLSAAGVFHPMHYRNGSRRFTARQRTRYQNTKITIGKRLFGISGDNLGRNERMVFGKTAARFEAYPVFVNGRAINQAQLVAHSHCGISNQQQSAAIKVVKPGAHKTVTANTTRGFYGSNIRTNSSRLLIVTDRGARISGLKNLAIENMGTSGDKQMILLSKRIPQRWKRTAEGVLFTKSQSGNLKTSLMVTSKDGKRSTKVKAKFIDTGISSCAVPPGVSSWKEANRLMTRSRSEHVPTPR